MSAYKYLASRLERLAADVRGRNDISDESGGDREAENLAEEGLQQRAVLGEISFVYLAVLDCGRDLRPNGVEE